MTLPTSSSGRSKGERDVLSHWSFSSSLFLMSKDGQKEGALIIISLFN
jgi:hypothetical protein